MEEERVYTDTKLTTKPEKKETKRFKWFAFGCLSSLIMIVLFFIAIIVGLTMLSRGKTPEIKDNTILNLSISGSLEEHREVDDRLFSMTPTSTATEIIRKINIAADDSSIDAILIEPNFIVAGYPVLNEVVSALENFQQNGKSVYAYLEMSSNRDYFLASIADHIILHPAASSGIYLSGIGISSLYMKDLLDKLGIEMTVLHSGAYKGAGEEFAQSEMSPQMRETFNHILDDYYEQLIADLARQRGLSNEQIRHILEDRENLVINGSEAVDMGIVDYLLTREELVTQFKNEGSQLLSFRSYNRKEQPVKTKDAVAVVHLQGMIAASSESIFDMDSYLSSKKVKRYLQGLEKDDHIKSVVLRVNSPGGSALESDIIYNIISKFKDSKPVVVSMGNTAASGGYYISAPADYIIADPYTLTGSIGVAAMIPNFHKMSSSIGVNPVTMQRGKYSNFLNIWEQPKQSDISAMQRNLDRVYDEFIGRVSTGRGMTLAQVDEVAQGRLWTAKGALDANLIDEIGTLNTAIAKAAELAELTEYKVVTYPKTKSLFDIFMERRFDLTTLRDVTLRAALPEKELQRYWDIYQSLSNHPIQYLSPVLILDK